MRRITSHSDLLELIKTDVRYKWLVIYGYHKGGEGAYRYSSVEKIPFKVAMDWVTQWIVNNVHPERERGYHIRTCQTMTDHLNQYVGKISTDKDKEKYLTEPIP